MTNTVDTDRFYIKEDDTYPLLVNVLKEEIDGKLYVKDLTGATVTLNSRNKDSGAASITGGSASIVDAKAGKVSFTFSAAQTATPAVYEYEWSVDFGGGSIGTWPTEGYLEYEVVTEIA